MIKLTIQKEKGEEGGIWESNHMANGENNKNNRYVIAFSSPGKYKTSCRRWPNECSGLFLGVPKVNPKNQFIYKTISPELVHINIFEKEEILEIPTDQDAVEFELDLPIGKTILQTDFIEGENSYGVYYTYLSKVE